MIRRRRAATPLEPAAGHAPTEQTVLRPVPDGVQSLEFRTIHGYRRAFRMAGQGPVVLLIHGIGDNSSAWSETMDLLAPNFTVIAPDLLGHGLSDKPRADYSVAAYANAMRDLLSVLGIRRVTVVGHSLGGGVAMQFCYQFPEFVERLVLVSTGGVTRDVSPLLRMLALPGINASIAALRLPGLVPTSHHVGTVASKVLDPVSPALPRRLRELIHDAPEMMRIVDGLADATAHAAFTRTLRAVVDWRGQVVTMLDRSYLTARLPVMLVWGTGDSVIPHHHALLAHSAMPHSLLESFEGAGHFPHHDDPVRFVTAVERFIAATAPMEHDTDEWSDLLSAGPSVDDLTGPRRVQEEVLEELASERSAT